MQVAAGMQGDHALAAIEVAGAVVGHDVLMHMLRRQAMVIAQRLASGHQFGVVLQAGELLAGLQQAAAQVAFAGAPVQPVTGLFAEGQVAGEGFDLLPFAAGDGYVEAVRGGGQVGFREVAECRKLSSLLGQLRERGGQRGSGGVGFGVCQGALAQMGGKLGVGGFPGQLQAGEGAGFPQLLVLDQELVEGLEAGA
ncbi:hypothetical protein D3C71_1431150 [compost metagenome]